MTKSYQYSPWGERLSQVKHNTDGTTEDGYYGYNSHTDVETVTDANGDTKATYGYTAYGNNDDAEFTGIDKPDVADPTKEAYNPYRYNAKRWDAHAGTYDMGFRDYSPGLNRFTTRDMYNGALADMGLGTDPFTGNRYAFTSGNPINFIELDGHRPADCDEPGATCRMNRGGGWDVSGTPTQAQGPVAAVAPKVENGRLKGILGEVYLKPGSVPEVGDGKVGTALISELQTGRPTKGLWHAADAADQLTRLVKLLEEDRKPDKALTLSAADRAVALAEADEIWKALNTTDDAGAVTKLITENSEVYNSVKSAGERMWRAPAMKSITGAEYDANTRGVPRLKGEPKLPKLMNGAGVLADLHFIWEGVSSILRGDQPCDVTGTCPVPEYI